MVIELTIW